MGSNSEAQLALGHDKLNQQILAMTVKWDLQSQQQQPSLPVDGGMLD